MPHHQKELQLNSVINHNFSNTRTEWNNFIIKVINTIMGFTIVTMKMMTVTGQFKGQVRVQGGCTSTKRWKLKERNKTHNQSDGIVHRLFNRSTTRKTIKITATKIHHNTRTRTAILYLLDRDTFLKSQTDIVRLLSHNNENAKVNVHGNKVKVNFHNKRTVYWHTSQPMILRMMIR